MAGFWQLNKSYWRDQVTLDHDHERVSVSNKHCILLVCAEEDFPNVSADSVLRD